MSLEKYKYIVVEGPIGVGKTSLARRIAAETGAQPLMEQPQENPFLERFYRDSARYALPTQLNPAPYLFDTQTAPIYFGGDAFGSSRVEGAALSGLAIGHALTERLTVR